SNTSWPGQPSAASTRPAPGSAITGDVEIHYLKICECSTGSGEADEFTASHVVLILPEVGVVRRMDDVVVFNFSFVRARLGDDAGSAGWGEPEVFGVLVGDFLDGESVGFVWPFDFPYFPAADAFLVAGQPVFDAARAEVDQLRHFGARQSGFLAPCPKFRVRSRLCHGRSAFRWRIEKGLRGGPVRGAPGVELPVDLSSTNTVRETANPKQG